VKHTKNGVGTDFNDIGADGEDFPMGALTFDAHPVFRDPALVHLENGAIITDDGGVSAMRFDPPIAVAVDADTQITNVSVKARVLAGDSFSIGGIAPVRALLTTEAATLASPVNPNAVSVTVELASEHGAAWQEFFERISQGAGLVEGSEYTVEIDEDVDGEEDLVTWTVLGKGTPGNDIRLGTGLAVYDVTIS
jgi:hypothetical protein